MCELMIIIRVDISETKRDDVTEKLDDMVDATNRGSTLYAA